MMHAWCCGEGGVAMTSLGLPNTELRRRSGLEFFLLGPWAPLKYVSIT